MHNFGLGCICNDGCRFDNYVHLDSGNMNQLGRGRSKNYTEVSLRLIFRGITALGGASHWAWILESNEIKKKIIYFAQSNKENKVLYNCNISRIR